MSTGRTVKRYSRFYSNGYDLSGYTRQFGPLDVEFEIGADAALSDEIKAVLNGHASIKIGELSGFFDNTATAGLHAHASDGYGLRTIMAAIGIRNAPAQGEPVFAGIFEQLAYKAVPETGFVVASMPFGNESILASMQYENPWGVLLAPNAARTAVNSSTGVDDWGAQTTFGGFMCYQLFASNGTVTLSVQDAATNVDGSFAALSGATSGSINASVTPAAGIVALSRTATVRRYLRWQLAFGTASSATFALSFHRAVR